MEFIIKATDIDDAKDIFLLAKDRLLDITYWDYILKKDAYSISLTNENGEKAHRDARVSDFINIAKTNTESLKIEQIQYDYFPDIDSECIAMLLKKPVDTTPTPAETFIIRRDMQSLIAHCNMGNELPAPEDELPTEHLKPESDKHPLLTLSNSELQKLLQSFISPDEL